MYTKKGTGYSFKCAETDKVSKLLMWNNIGIASVVISMIIVVGKYFSITGHSAFTMVGDDGFYLIGYCITFGLLFLLLIGVISIRPNDRLKRFLVRGIWDKLQF